MAAFDLHALTAQLDQIRGGGARHVLTSADGSLLQIFCPSAIGFSIERWEELCVELISSTNQIEGTYGAMVPPNAIHMSAQSTLKRLFRRQKVAAKVALDALTSDRIGSWARMGALIDRAARTTPHYLPTLALLTNEGYQVAVEFRPWCDGDLYDETITNPSPPEVGGVQIVQVMRDISSAVSALRADEVLGRYNFDLKPQNCLFNINPETGEAQGFLSDAFAEEERVTAVTMGRVEPIYKYTAPEMGSGEPYDLGATDVFAQAVILNAALSCQQAYPGMRAESVPTEVRRGVRPALFRDVPSKVGGLSPEQEGMLVQLLEVSWHADPALRPTPGQFCEALGSILSA